MSRASEITVAERQILDFIKFRSNDKHRFFGSNEYLGDSIGLQTTSVKNMVNRLVRLEYLTRTMEGKKRYLHYTGKKYKSVVTDLSNYDKAYLRKQVAHFKQEYEDAKEQIDLLKTKIEQLNTELDNYERSGKVLMHLLKQFGFDEKKVTEVFPGVHKELFGY